MFKLTRVNRIKHLIDKKKNIDLSYKCFRLQQIILLFDGMEQHEQEERQETSASSELCLQNRSCGLRKYDHVSEVLKSLKWLSVRNKPLFNDLVMGYKCVKNLTPGYLHGRFQYRAKTNQRVARQNNDLTLPRYRLATGRKTFTYRGAKLYNTIAKDIKDAGNLNVFKKRIFQYLFNSQIVFYYRNVNSL